MRAPHSDTTDLSRTERSALVEALGRLRYEVLPLPGVEAQVLEHVPRQLTVTVTASPRRGLEATLTLTETLARHGFDVVPHLAARQVTDQRRLREVLHRLTAAGVRDAFVVAGDSASPAGPYPDAMSLLTAMLQLGHQFEQIGVAAYPEGHPSIPDERLTRALAEKAPLSTYLVTQLCFDPGAVSAWVGRLRAQGIGLPVYVGVAGPVDRLRLLRVATRIGVGPSARFLRKHRRSLLRLVLPSAYRPDRLLRQLAPELSDSARGVIGLHLYTLGDLHATEQWRRRVLARYERRELT